ncbi:hypothetical protein BFU36_12775 [Sulfolobus sp. A20]|uniref:MFS transporter n=1 Tax=Saccharolobus sp. A20 TaxID=1891280 RepID=UPI000845FE65|nr:MFS transporter [Sulfolobus sp. A20]TRM75329.1 MFS transporter [Sulfolobus sp. E5]TRM76192.1 MFS transporter [Sulfolobus sp. A20-N-F8]TRM79081.1 MFS transporter [Sulfolobus sp. B5]TRM81746.1 MFS transporter [Sulfolobus sp. D5]TRM83266.1 MFS transporter [Sulfolobus sp. A20-N-F6]TRM85283.1 MFS transporter [Sulfolobus sp. F3]TRN01794.1 MFS transporter [Sulfolobus sp. F1]TRN01880.1 MFS transporter [Sulfolobus sp. E1]
MEKKKGYTSISLSKYIPLISVGTLIEWYDLFVVGIAASLIWPLLYYPTTSSAAALAASIATYGSVFFTRPIGAVIFGHFGDRIGRKTMLIWTLVITAVGMGGMALTPTYSTIGILAPLSILIFRLIQGIGLGGEYGGAATILVEYLVDSKKRGYYSSFLQSTVPLGVFFAILGLLLTRTYMSHEVFINIGWRILIGAGAIALIIGGIVRYILMESPLFQQLIEKGEVERSPSAKAFKKEWKTMILLAFSWAYIVTIFAIIFFPTGLSYMTSLRIPQTTIYTALFAGAVAGFLATIIGGYVSDIFGRKTVLWTSGVLTIIASYLYFALVSTKDPMYIIIANSFLNFSYFLGYGAVAVFFTEQFLTKYRYTAAGFSYQLAAIITGVYTSFLLPIAIVTAHGLLNANLYLFLMALSLCIFSIISIIPLKETKGVKID